MARGSRSDQAPSPLWKGPEKNKFARAHLGKRLLVSVAPLEDVFVEYAFELAAKAESGSPARSDAAKAASSA